MLVLTRKAEQKIRIGSDIVITVLKIQGDQVSIGIKAPINLQIVREELILDDLSKNASQKKVASKHEQDLAKKLKDND